MIAEHSGKSQEEVSRDIERDKILTAEQAVEYGLIDSVLASRKGSLPVALSQDAGPGTAKVKDSCRVPVPIRARAGYFSSVCVVNAQPRELEPGAPGPLGPSREEACLWHASVTAATC